MQLPEEIKQDMKQAVMDIVEKDNAAFVEMTGGEDSTRKDWIKVDRDLYHWIVDMRERIREDRRGS